MADEKAAEKASENKTDKFAEKTPAGLPAYPQHIREETGEKYPDGSPKYRELGIANNVEEHKKMLSEKKPWTNK